MPDRSAPSDSPDAPSNSQASQKSQTSETRSGQGVTTQQSGIRPTGDFATPILPAAAPARDIRDTSDAGDISGSTGKPRSLFTDALYDLRRKPLFIIPLAVILFLAIVAIFPSLFTSVDPRFCQLSDAAKGPIKGHIFGFDRQGCDTFSRTVHGTRASLEVGLLVTVGAVLLGAAVGALAGFYGGLVDSVLSRVTDVFFALPLLLGAIVFLSNFQKRTVFVVAFALIVLGWTQIARIMRGSVIGVKDADYVLAARALGAKDSRLLFRHVLPNAIAPVIVVATISLGIFIVAEATLSYLGIGLPPTTVSWGGDINNATAALRTTPRILLIPAGALSITVLSFILLGEAVREALDPRLR